MTDARGMLDGLMHDSNSANQQITQDPYSSVLASPANSDTDNAPFDPAVPGTSTMGQTPAERPHPSSTISALLDLSKSSPPPDKYNTTESYEDLLLPYCDCCCRLATVEDEQGYCGTCQSTLIYKCARCNSEISAYDLGITHLNTVHNVFQRVFCPICGYAAKDVYAMSNHMEKHDNIYNSSDDD